MSRLPIPMIQPGSPPRFPPPAQALASPNGLLAIGGDLAPERLLAAYRQGIFPWFGEDEPILWWSPDPRCVFATDAVRPGHSLRRLFARSPWTVTFDRAFDRVIRACAEPRDDAAGTWIVPPMIDAYEHMHALGHAHSVEVWDNDSLVGGLYGVAIGRMFCGESMFSRLSGGSKAALFALCRQLRAWQCPLLDAQVENPHLMSLGATLLPRGDFLSRIERLVEAAPMPWASAVSLAVAQLAHGDISPAPYPAPPP